MNPFSTLRKLATGGNDPNRVDELVRMANGEQSLLMAARQRVRELYEGARDAEKAQSLLMSAVLPAVRGPNTPGRLGHLFHASPSSNSASARRVKQACSSFRNAPHEGEGGVGMAAQPDSRFNHRQLDQHKCLRQVKSQA
jgi:hypothetical protein